MAGRGEVRPGTRLRARGGEGEGHMSTPLGEMTATEIVAWVRDVRARLAAKMDREQAYLSRRARHGRQTRTDDALRADQELARDVLALLSEVEQAALGAARA